MDRFMRARGARFAVIAGVIVLAFLAAPAAGAVPCSQRVLEDWSDNGRVDRAYQLQCYDEAIDALPADLRDYTDAAEVIQRAQSRATRARQVAGEIEEEQAAGIGTAGASSFPVAPVIGAVAALAVVLAGGAAYVVRRRGSA